MSINLDKYYYIEHLKHNYSLFRSLKPYNHPNSGFNIESFQISFKTSAQIWDQYTNVEALEYYWNNCSKNSITVNFRLAKINITNSLYSRLINPYKCTISDIQELERMTKDERFKTYMVIMTLLRIISLNTSILSTPNMDNYKINALEFPPKEMLNAVLYECLQEFDYIEYKDDYKRYLEEFFTNGLDNYITNNIIMKGVYIK